LLDRLTALSARLELVAESPAAQKARASAALNEIHAELTGAALSARALVGEAASQIPTPGVADLGEIVIDTVASLERYFRQRESTYELSPIPRGTSIAIEPEVLRATLAAAIDVLLGPALPSERLRIVHEAGSLAHVLRLVLEMRGAPPPLPAAEAKLAALGAWVELRSGRVEIRRGPSSLSVELELPAAPAAPTGAGC
jgi:hypothetical protein